VQQAIARADRHRACLIRSRAAACRTRRRTLPQARCRNKSSHTGHLRVARRDSPAEACGDCNRSNRDGGRITRSADHAMPFPRRGECDDGNEDRKRESAPRMLRRWQRPPAVLQTTRVPAHSRHWNCLRPGFAHRSGRVRLQRRNPRDLARNASSHGFPELRRRIAVHVEQTPAKARTDGRP